VSYRFQRNETVTEAVVRLARVQTKKTLYALAQTRQPRERLHEVRTSIKKLRALLRLVRPRLGRRFRRQDDHLRAQAKKLSELRDAAVLIETCAALGKIVEKKLRPTLQRERRLLGIRCTELEARLDGPERRHAIAQALQRFERRIERWSLSSADAAEDAGILLTGLARVYRRGRRAFATAYGEKGGPAALHAWRRAVKYHGYHIRLLADVLPVHVQGRLEPIEQLGQLLGEDHDLTVLSTRLRVDSGSLGDNVKLRLLLRRIDQRQASLRETARALGHTLYADRTSIFRRRLQNVAEPGPARKRSLPSP
jgi:CHAD domain-containing protein